MDSILILFLDEKAGQFSTLKYRNLDIFSDIKTNLGDSLCGKYYNAKFNKLL